MPNARLAGINEACGIATPVPLSPAVCGDPAALSVIVMEADRDPDACGENVTEILQLPPAATEAPHVFVWLKSPVFAPVTATLVIDRAAVPGFDSVIVCAALVVPRF